MKASGDGGQTQLQVMGRCICDRMITFKSPAADHSSMILQMGINGMKNKYKTKITHEKLFALRCMLMVFFAAAGSRDAVAAAAGSRNALAADAGCICETFPLERNGIPLHLDRVKAENTTPAGQILLIHGSTYSSHEFDIDYQDYSLVRRLAREGYAVWRLDIAGYGQSGPVEDGSMPDTAYAADDIDAAVDMIVKISGKKKIDVLGWSWGTMTAGRFAAEHPEHLGKLILYAPILSGLGEQEPGEAFSHNTWESAAEDFQRNADGSFDLNVTDPILIELFCSSCWHYDGDTSPKGWSKDAFVEESTKLIDLERISSPTLIICGSKDPYMNLDLLGSALGSLPEGSELRMIEGGSHIMMYEKNCYHEFQNRIVEFLSSAEPRY